MLKALNALLGRRRHNERGSEFAAAIIVFPVLFVLIIGSIEVGFYVRTRMLTENIARDAARQVAVDGGNYNPRTNTTSLRVDVSAAKALTNGSKCKLSSCTAPPTISCNKITNAAGSVYYSDLVSYAGETVTCTVNYHYKPLASALMNGPLGLGIGNLLQPFVVQESARAETGTRG